jgi:hypothetical protein
VTANGVRRRLNCKACRGKGTVACAACTRGKVACPSCHEAKKLARWLEVRTTPRLDVQVAPDDLSTRAFTWSEPGSRVSDAQLARDAHIVDVVAKPRCLAPDELPSILPTAWRTEHAPRLQAHIEAGERVQAQTFTFLAVPSVAVAYVVLGEQHSVGFEGLRMLSPPASAPAAEPFRRRSRMLGRAMVALGALPVAAGVSYAARGAYFATGRPASLAIGVIAAAAAAAILAYVVLANATLGRRPARRWAAATIAPVAVATVLALLAEPSVDRARALVAAGELEPAAAELRALKLPETDDEWAELYLRRVLATTTCAAATAELGDIRAELPQRIRAQRHADDTAIADAEAALRSEDADGASRALDCASEPAREGRPASRIRCRIADLRVRRCLARKDWSCAMGLVEQVSDRVEMRIEVLLLIRQEADARAAAAAQGTRLENRIEDAQVALALWRTYLLGTPRPAVLPAVVLGLQRALAIDQAALARQQQLAQGARANRSSGGLLCNDGTLSPTCTCGGPHRGCCSWHGGIAGCQ